MLRILVVLLPLLLWGCSEQASPPAAAITTSADAMLEQFLAQAYAEDMARAPYTASSRGDKSVNNRWDSESEAFQTETRRLWEERLAQLQQFNPELLSAPRRLSLQLFRLDLERRIASDAFRHHKFVIHQHSGPHTDMPSNLINKHPVGDIADAEDYIDRLQDTGRWFDEVIEQLEIRTAKGLFLADWQYPKMIAASNNVVTGAPYDKSAADSALLADFRAKVAALNLPAAQQADLLQRATVAMLDSVQPAYQRLIAALQAQALLADGRDGVWKFPDGDAFYAERLRWFTTTDMSADDVHALGLQQVARLHGEMREIMARVGFEGDLSQFMQFVRDDDQFYYPNTDAGRAAYLAEARRLIAAMNDRLPEVFGLLPKADVIVKRVEIFRQDSAGNAFYSRPPVDGSRPGIYYVNLKNMRSTPAYQMEALAYHEGVPGHHLERALSGELTGIPEFQKYTSFTAYTEGWGLYSELLPKEMGAYEDPYADFGRLAMELWRAARLVVDTGLHHKRWTRAEAVAYLDENTPGSTAKNTKAIERYIAMPGQATAYMIGKQSILSLREQARAALGDDFDIRQFHDEVLKDGAVPLSILERKINALIERGG